MFFLNAIQGLKIFKALYYKYNYKFVNCFLIIHIDYKMKKGRMWIFMASLLIWFILLGLMIYALVYAPMRSWPKQYVFVIVLFFISFTQIVKKAFKFAYNSDRRF